MTGAELDRAVKAELRSLPRSLADLVAQHLVASGQLIEDDPELAYLHAKTARRLAARLSGVREAVAVTAYLAEHYDEALAEFRAVRRMTGNHEVLPTMADCERALGRPEKALALSREKQVKDLEIGSQMEMLIVAAGARRDMGQTPAAIQMLEVPELTKRTRAEWLPRLRYAYADALQEGGRTDDALIWFHRAAGVDGDGLTGAAERAAELEGLLFTDLDTEDEIIADDELDEVTAVDETDVADVVDEEGTCGRSGAVVDEVADGSDGVAVDDLDDKNLADGGVEQIVDRNTYDQVVGDNEVDDTQDAGVTSDAGAGEVVVDRDVDRHDEADGVDK